ncbi:MAG: lipoyl(octanoyl) transferase LipB [Thermoanaerobaculia bacterium]|nr:lipoyl(octanoyl) transferase LipB [Thermoanaerobaculia bacterium]
MISTSVAPRRPSYELPDLNGPSAGRPLYWSWLGRRSYGSLFGVQEDIRRELWAGEGPERLLLLEHEPVFTIGRNADPADVLADRSWLENEGIDVCESNRGGQVTYHGPGQLVGYPIVSLNPDRRDIGLYVRNLQEVLIRVLAEFGIEARRRDDGKEFIGVWVGQQKIASIGVHLSRWIAIHGFALNVTTRLEHFDGIVACGLDGVEMTSMEQQLAEAPPMEKLAQRVAVHFGEVFERQMMLAENVLG